MQPTAHSFANARETTALLQPSALTETAPPCYSVRLFRPFITALRAAGRNPSALNAQLSALDASQRMYVSYAHNLLREADNVLAEPALGVNASMAQMPGDWGLLEYVMRTAATPRLAIAAGTRYVRLISDVHDLSLHVVGPRAVVKVDCRVQAPPVSEDFILVSLLRKYVLDWSGLGPLEAEAWFQHPKPDDSAPWQRALGASRLHFNATFSGVGFAARHLDTRLRQHEPRLHAVLCAAATDSVSQVLPCLSVTERVHEVVAKRMGTHEVKLHLVALELGVQPRKLARALAREGTTFDHLVEAVRRKLAVQYVALSDEPFLAVARRTGFGGAPAFHRAFRRWTGQTPLRYRRSVLL